MFVGDRGDKMTKLDYERMLRQLPIDNPKCSDLRALFPHLSTQEIGEVLTPQGERGTNSVSTPPLRVGDFFQVLDFVWGYKKRDGSVMEPELRVNHGYKMSTEFSHQDKARAYAREYWGDDLVVDNWVDFSVIYVQDPSDLAELRPENFASVAVAARESIPFLAKGFPKTKARVYFTMSRDWNAILNDHSRPRSKLIDDAVLEMTLDPLVVQELKGRRPMPTEWYNCALDGSGLNVRGCGECGNKFMDDNYRTGWDTPIPRKLTELLVSSDFQFRQDPEIARGKESERFYGTEK